MNKPKFSKRDKKGRLHRRFGPAQILDDGTKQWWYHGKKHRTNGPAVIYPDGGKEWWLNNKPHRAENEPCAILSCGSKAYVCKGEIHRTDGPALEIMADTTAFRELKILLNGGNYGYFIHGLNLNSIYNEII